MEVPGLTPTLPPSMTDGPVLVTVEPAKTAYRPAAPRMISASACNGKAARAKIPNRIRRVRFPGRIGG